MLTIPLFLLSLGTSQPLDTPLLAWRFDRENFSAGAFPLENAKRRSLSLHTEGAPTFVGEEGSEALVRSPEDPLISAGPALDPELLPSQRIALEAWVAVDRPQHWGGFLSAIEDNGDYERGWMLGYRNDQFCFALATEGLGRLSYLSTPPVFRSGVWYHVVGTYDGKLQRLFVNGIQVGQREMQGSILYHEQHLLTAGSFKDQDEEHRMVGALHSVAVFDRELSPKDVRKRFERLRGSMPAPNNETFTGVELQQAPAVSEFQPRINTAIDRGVEWLLERQNRDGSWSPMVESYRNGPTSLALYALLESGLSRSHPSVAAALDFLRRSTPRKTYSVACQLLAISALGAEADRDWVERLVELLIEFENDAEPGSWAYPAGAQDLSNTQFAALGFHAASKLGVEVPLEIWQRMVQTTVSEHQPSLREVPWVEEELSGTGQRRIGGFTYRPRSDVKSESGSMTTAGLCVLGFAQKVAGPALGRRTIRTIERAKRPALDWLTYHYSVSRNPGRGGHVYYYLWGLERVGAIFELETFGDHPWYRDGALWLVDGQKEDGDWAGNHNDTCFALLFLNRATATASGSGAAPSLGRVWSTEGGELGLRITGRTELTLWITGIHSPTAEGEEAPGSNAPLAVEAAARRRIVKSVQYLTSGGVFAEVPGGEEPWDGERFPVRHIFETPGARTIRAELTFSDGSVLTSDELVVESKPDPAEWMERNLARMGRNLYLDQKVEVTASSLREESKSAKRAVDGLEGTAWISSAEDAEPWILIRSSRPIRANKLVLSPIDAHLAARSKSDHALRVEVRLNGKPDPRIAEAADDPLEPLVVTFERAEKIRTLEVKIVARIAAGADPGPTGFAEVALQLEE